MFAIVLVSAVKDVDTKEKIADMETKIVELEKQNAGLKNKVHNIIVNLFINEKVIDILNYNSLV